MTFRALDNNHDWTFGAGTANYVSANDEIALNLKTRLLSFWNNCFFDLEAGIDWFGLLEYNQQENLQDAINAVIIETEGITAINDIQVVMRSGRNVNITYDVKTIYKTNYKDEIQGLIYG